MKKLFLAACVLFMFGTVAQAQSLTKKAVKAESATSTTLTKAVVDNADMDQKAADAAEQKAPAAVNNPYTEKRKADVEAQKAAMKKAALNNAAPADTKKKVKNKIDN